MILMNMFKKTLFGKIKMIKKHQKEIQITEILKKLKVKDVEDGKAILDFLIDFLIYLPVGSTLLTTQVGIKKVADEFIQLDIKIEKEEMVDMLEKANIIKLI